MSKNRAKNLAQKSVPQCQFDRGWRGLKHIWAMPIWKRATTHFNKGLPKIKRESQRLKILFLEPVFVGSTCTRRALWLRPSIVALSEADGGRSCPLLYSVVLCYIFVFFVVCCFVLYCTMLYCVVRSCIFVFFVVCCFVVSCPVSCCVVLS